MTLLGALDRLGRRPATVAALLAAVYALFLVWLGFTAHPIEVPGGESDNYVHGAELILEGRLPRDPYRPLFYPLMVAPVGALLGDCFVAGRIVSALLAGLFVFCGFGLARTWIGAGPAMLVSFLMIVNGELAVHGTQVATDVAFAAFATATLWACARAANDPRARAGILPGIGFALAWFTRYTAIALLVPVVLALCLPRALSARGRLARLGAFVGTAGVCLIPHFVLTWKIFGSPLHDENWRSMAMNVYGDWDARHLEDSPLDGLWSVLTHEPLRVLEAGLEGLASFFRDGARILLQGSHPAGLIGSLCLLLCAAGIVRSVRQRRGGVPLVFGLVYMLLVCFTFHPFERLLLPLLPVLYGAAVAGLLWPAPLATAAARPVGLGLGLALVAAVASGLPFRLALFSKQHPLAEVRAARHLVESQPEPFRLLASYASMHRHIPYPADWIPAPGIAGRSRPEAYLQRVRRTVEETGARFVLLGRSTLPPALFEALRAREPPFLRRIEADDDVVVFEVVGLAPQWIADFAVQPNPFAGGSLRLQVDLLDGDHVDRIAYVVVGIERLGEADAGLEPVSLPRVSRLLHRAVFEDPALAPGEYRLTPAAFDQDGRMSQSASVVLSVR